MNFKPTFDRKTERDLRALRNLYRRTEAAWDFASVILRANSARGSPQRELLYHWLCKVWTNHFHGEREYELPFSRPSLGGEPYGPLIDFILAGFRQVNDLPKPEAVAKAIIRERKGRDRCRQLVLQLQERMGF